MPNLPMGPTRHVAIFLPAIRFIGDWRIPDHLVVLVDAENQANKGVIGSIEALIRGQIHHKMSGMLPMYIVES